MLLQILEPELKMKEEWEEHQKQQNKNAGQSKFERKRMTDRIKEKNCIEQNKKEAEWNKEREEQQNEKGRTT